MVLLVIDIVNDLFRQVPLEVQLDQLTKSTNHPGAGERKSNVPISWIPQEFLPDLSGAFSVMRKKGTAIAIRGTEGYRILD